MDSGQGRRLAAHWDGLQQAAVAGVRTGSPAAVLDDIAAVSVARAHILRSERLPAPESQRHPAPPKAALDRLRHDNQQLRPYLREWLIAAADRGYRLPAEDLPLLRSLVAGDPMCAIPAARLAGPAGWDLALGRPELFDEEPGLFRTGTIVDWCLYLRTLRAHDPDRARELLEAEWWRPWAPDLRRVTARERVLLLRTFEVNLSLDDEPFLETLLDGRIKLTRLAAAKLLAALPGSAYGERMARRAFACIRADPREFVLTGKIEQTADAFRDKVGELGQVQHRSSAVYSTVEGDLVNALSATPLAAWPKHFGLSRRKVMRRLLGADFQIHHGLFLAILRQRDAAWVAAAVSANLRPQHVLHLIAPEDLDDAASDRVLALSSSVLGDLPVPWPDRLARRLWSEAAEPGIAYKWSRGLDLMVRGLPVAFEAEARVLAASIGRMAHGSEQTRRLVDVLGYRRTLLDELAGPADAGRPGDAAD